MLQNIRKLEFEVRKIEEYEQNGNKLSPELTQFVKKVKNLRENINRAKSGINRGFSEYEKLQNMQEDHVNEQKQASAEREKKRKDLQFKKIIQGKLVKYKTEGLSIPSLVKAIELYDKLDSSAQNRLKLYLNDLDELKRKNLQDHINKSGNGVYKHDYRQGVDVDRFHKNLTDLMGRRHLKRSWLKPIAEVVYNDTTQGLANSKTIDQLLSEMPDIESELNKHSKKQKESSSNNAHESSFVSQVGAKTSYYNDLNDMSNVSITESEKSKKREISKVIKESEINLDDELDDDTEDDSQAGMDVPGNQAIDKMQKELREQQSGVDLVNNIMAKPLVPSNDNDEELLEELELYKDDEPVKGLEPYKESVDKLYSKPNNPLDPQIKERAKAIYNQLPKEYIDENEIEQHHVEKALKDCDDENVSNNSLYSALAFQTFDIESNQMRELEEMMGVNQSFHEKDNEIEESRDSSKIASKTDNESGKIPMPKQMPKQSYSMDNIPLDNEQINSSNAAKKSGGKWSFSNIFGFGKNKENKPKKKGKDDNVQEFSVKLVEHHYSYKDDTSESSQTGSIDVMGVSPPPPTKGLGGNPDDMNEESVSIPEDKGRFKKSTFVAINRKTEPELNVGILPPIDINDTAYDSFDFDNREKPSSYDLMMLANDKHLWDEADKHEHGALLWVVNKQTSRAELMWYKCNKEKDEYQYKIFSVQKSWGKMPDIYNVIQNYDENKPNELLQATKDKYANRANDKRWRDLSKVKRQKPWFGGRFSRRNKGDNYTIKVDGIESMNMLNGDSMIPYSPNNITILPDQMTKGYKHISVDEDDVIFILTDDLSAENLYRHAVKEMGSQNIGDKYIWAYDKDTDTARLMKIFRDGETYDLHTYSGKKIPDEVRNMADYLPDRVGRTPSGGDDVYKGCFNQRDEDFLDMTERCAKSKWKWNRSKGSNKIDKLKEKIQIKLDDDSIDLDPVQPDMPGDNSYIGGNTQGGPIDYNTQGGDDDSVHIINGKQTKRKDDEVHPLQPNEYDNEHDDEFGEAEELANTNDEEFHFDPEQMHADMIRLKDTAENSGVKLELQDKAKKHYTKGKSGFSHNGKSIENAYTIPCEIGGEKGTLIVDDKGNYYIAPPKLKEKLKNDPAAARMIGELGSKLLKTGNKINFPDSGGDENLNIRLGFRDAAAADGRNPEISIGRKSQNSNSDDNDAMQLTSNEPGGAPEYGQQSSMPPNGIYTHPGQTMFGGNSMQQKNNHHHVMTEPPHYIAEEQDDDEELYGPEGGNSLYSMKGGGGTTTGGQ